MALSAETDGERLARRAKERLIIYCVAAGFLAGTAWGILIARWIG